MVNFRDGTAGHEAGSDERPHEPGLVHMLEGRLEEEHQRRAHAETELDREHSEVETLRQVIMDIESKHVARRTEWQVQLTTKTCLPFLESLPWASLLSTHSSC